MSRAEIASVELHWADSQNNLSGENIRGVFPDSIQLANSERRTIVKRSRVALVAPVLMIIGLWLGRSGFRGRRGSAFPWISSGFLVLMVVNSTGFMPIAVGRTAAGLGSILIFLALTAAAICSPIARILDLACAACS